MSGPTIPTATFIAFTDLTNPDSVTITARPGSATQRHTINIGFFEAGARITLYLTPGSLEALGDAIATHLAFGDPDVG